ncbi:MAG: DUF1287 domain-containing protein, partial [bacterium]|nr:DUF1287 domain-containing protein [bacterium]
MPKILLTLSILLLLAAPIGAQQPPEEFPSRLVAAAMERLSHEVTYDGAYRRIDYPGGDVPDQIGVCTDLVLRAYRGVG